ncbi:MAG TPA: DUF2127 domain-containing protein [Acidobacteriaceae bacterium]|nr:DUF2127 domain-containing protein [Acidobacteriaceae bacterium]
MATHVSSTRSKHISAYDKWLVVIGALKLCEAALFIALGIGVLRLLHKDLVDELTHLMLALHHDPEGRLSSLLLDKVALLDPHRLKQISAAIFAHAGLDILEGTGLVLRKVWAEFVTVILSGFFLPFEFMALARHVTWLRVGVTAVNVAVVIYLIFHLRMKLRERQPARA